MLTLSANRDCLASNGVNHQGFKLGYRPALDGLRGVAVLLVFLWHAAPYTFNGGLLGVDLFFVLSGFLITSLLLTEAATTGKIQLGRFYLRRACRLLPALAVFLPCCCLMAQWLMNSEGAAATIDQAIWVMCYLFNWHVNSGAVGGGYLVHCWSLAVEEQFYFAWPVLLAGLVLLKVRRHWIVALALVGVAVPSVLRFVIFDPENRWSILRIYVGTDTRCDAMFWGALAGIAACWGWLPQTKTGRRLLKAAALAAALVLALQVAFAAPTHHPTRYHYYFGYSIMGLCTALVITALVHEPPRILAWPLELAPLRWLGRISYGFYLWHLPLLQWVDVFHVGPRWLALLIQFVVSVAVATISYLAVERYFLKRKSPLKRRLALSVQKETDTTFDLEAAERRLKCAA